MTARAFFIAGTDTGVGKTHVATAWLNAASRQGRRTLGLKPVAAGAEPTSLGWRNDDALALQRASSVKLPYEAINPWCFPDPVAPHLAAQDAGVPLSAVTMVAAMQQAMAEAAAELVLVEGAGGWRVPLNAGETLADVARGLHLPVILVVGMRLGCLNHALLSAEAIRADGLRLHGWVANDLGQPMPHLQANIDTLAALLDMPPLDWRQGLPG